MFDFLKSIFTKDNITNTVVGLAKSFLTNENVTREINRFFFNKVNEVLSNNEYDYEKVDRITEMASMGIETLILVNSLLAKYDESKDLDTILASEEYQKLYNYVNGLISSNKTDIDKIKREVLNLN